MATPDKPSRFSPDGVANGFETRFVSFIGDRPYIRPRAIHFHTNSARGEGSIESAWTHMNAKPNQNTLPHYQVDRTHGGRARGCKFLPTNRRGIGSTTVGPGTKVNGRLVWPTLTDAERATILAHPNVRDFTLVIETADTGTDADPAISPFDPGQLEMCAILAAYESIVHGIPLVFQTDPWSPGIGSHTDPAGFPYTTIHRGKYCPGAAKKRQVRELLIPRARVIAAAWTGTQPPPDPTPDPAPIPSPPGPLPDLPIGVLDMILMAHEQGKSTFWFSPNGGLTRHPVRDMDHALALVAIGAIDARTRGRLTAENWGNASIMGTAELDRRLGRAVP